MTLPRRLHRSAPRGAASPVLGSGQAQGQGAGDVRHGRGDPGGDCDHDRDAAPEEARRRCRRSTMQAGGRRNWARLRSREAHNQRAQCGCRCRQESGRGIWVEEVPVDPGPVFRSAVCAASNGRASICAWCTCNTVRGLAAMSGRVRKGRWTADASRSVGMFRPMTVSRFPHPMASVP